MRTLKRYLRPVRRISNRMLECKAGILLARSVEAAAKTGNHEAAPDAMVDRITRHASGLPVSAEEYQLREEQGNKLYGMMVDERLRSYGWVASAGTRIGVLHDLHLTVPDQAIYIWDCATDPDFRGQGYFQKLLDAIVMMHCPTSKTALVAVDSRNEASKKALLKAGFRPVFTYLSVRSLGRVLVSVVIKNGKLRRAQAQFDALG